MHFEILNFQVIYNLIIHIFNLIISVATKKSFCDEGHNSCHDVYSSGALLHTNDPCTGGTATDNRF